MAAEPSSDVDPNKLPPLPQAMAPHQSDSDVHLVLDARLQGSFNPCLAMLLLIKACASCAVAMLISCPYARALNSMINVLRFCLVWLLLATCMYARYCCLPFAFCNEHKTIASQRGLHMYTFSTVAILSTLLVSAHSVFFSTWAFAMEPQICPQLTCRECS